MLVKGLIMKIALKFKKSLPSNTHYILIFWRGSTEFTSSLRQPLYKYTEMREPTCSGRLFLPLWEEVTQLSLAKSDSVIRPGGLGGTIWFRRATGRKSRKMSNEGKRKKQNMKNRAHCVKSCTLRCVISQARKPVSEETIKQENANRGWVSRQGTAVWTHQELRWAAVSRKSPLVKVCRRFARQIH